MKVKPLVKKLNGACARGDKSLARLMYKKLLKKSLKHKHTQAVK